MRTTPVSPAEDPTAGGSGLPRQLWVLIAAAFIIAVGFGLITPVLPQFAHSFGGSATASAVVVSAFAFVRLVFAPSGGRLIARYGERPIYLAGLLIVAASTLATAFAQSYWQLIVFRGIGGVGSVMFTVSAVALLVRLAPPHMRGRVSSAYASAFLFGGIAGPAIGGALGGFGLRVPFIVYAAALLLAAAVVAAALSHAALAASLPQHTQPPLTVALAWRERSYRAALVSSFANGWVNFGVRNAIVPLFAAAMVSGASWVAGLALASFAVGNALALSVAGRWADTRGRRPLVLAGLAVTAASMAVTGLAGSVVPLVGVSVIAGIGAGLFNPAAQAAMADIVGRERNGGPALAAYQMLSDAGAFIGPIAAGVLVDHGGFQLAFGVGALVAATAWAAWWRAPETLASRQAA